MLYKSKSAFDDKFKPQNNLCGLTERQREGEIYKSEREKERDESEKEQADGSPCLTERKEATTNNRAGAEIDSLSLRR